jgi:hypothetical protein
MHPAVILGRQNAKQASHIQVNQSYTEDILCSVCAFLLTSEDAHYNMVRYVHPQHNS